ncbi:MAG: hypothetical protein IKA99_06490 [Clostridia bacterium]|nr:hypothetical protein [Clostridia bacterium]
MKQVAKYNTCKGVSTTLTIGTPIVTLACCGDFFVHRSDTAISAAGMFSLFIVLLLFKDKFAEKWKMPSAFILSLLMFILLIMVEKIMLPMKYVCIATMISTGVDELTFKRFYKQIELLLPQEAQAFKHVGFIFTTTKKLEAINNK